MKKSELRKLIKEIIVEEKTLLRETAEVTCVFDGTESWGDVQQEIAGTAELPSNCTGNGGVGLNCFNPCTIMMTSISQVGNQTVITFAPSGITTYNPPTPDFDQSFYDEYEGEYGPFPGQEIRPDKAIPGKTPNLGKAKRRIKETIK